MTGVDYKNGQTRIRWAYWDWYWNGHEPDYNERRHGVVEEEPDPDADLYDDIIFDEFAP